jgi:hypothetical protein
MQNVVEDTPATWGTFARACRQSEYAMCDASQVCLPWADPPPAGFKQCISNDGDLPCPVTIADKYTEKHVFYTDISDTRGCTPCTCGAPSGSECSALISIYTDPACMSQLGSATVTSATPICDDFPAGSTLGSKVAGPVTYTPGACQPGGGEPMGQAVPIWPTTFCCIP